MLAKDGKKRLTDVADKEIETETGEDIVNGDNLLNLKKSGEKLKE